MRHIVATLILRFAVFTQLAIISYSTHTTPSTATLLHITDIHYDPLYRTGTPSNCISGMLGMRCCRAYDIPVQPHHPAGYWGDTNCDTPASLVGETLRWASQVLRPDVVLYTGDTVSHGLLRQGVRENIEASRVVTELFDQHFPQTPVFATHGNHDTFPVDQTIPVVYPMMLRAIGAQWSTPWLSPEAAHTFQTDGQYVQTVFPKLDIVSFNTVWYHHNNLFRSWYASENHSHNRWSWLNRTLAKSAAKGHTVWFIGHMAPGGGGTDAILNTPLHTTLSPYMNTLEGAFFGHSHRDQFRLMNGQWTATVAPSLMPAENGLACVRLYDYDTDTYRLMDYTDYCANVTAHGTAHVDNPNRPPPFVKRYSFRETYGLPDVSMQSWRLLYHMLQTNHTARQLYCKYQGRLTVSECWQAVKNVLVVL